jgi:plastocyanin
MLALLLASLPVALAATQTVKVGDGGALKFTPHTITGQVGDTIEFQWSSAGHSVTQSTFDKPCAPVNGGIFSGFLSTVR